MTFDVVGDGGLGPLALRSAHPTPRLGLQLVVGFAPPVLGFVPLPPGLLSCALGIVPLVALTLSGICHGGVGVGLDADTQPAVRIAEIGAFWNPVFSASRLWLPDERIASLAGVVAVGVIDGADVPQARRLVRAAAVGAYGPPAAGPAVPVLVSAG